MDSRLERKNIYPPEDNASKQSSFKSKDNIEDIFGTKRLKHQMSKDYKVYDRNTVITMFEKGISIPKYRKNSLLTSIKANTVQRQIDTVDAQKKKKRKRLDIKKVQEVKKRNSKSIIVLSKKDSSGDEEIFYKARTRVQQNYDQIKRILHDQDDYYSFQCLEEPQKRTYMEKQPSSINILTLKSKLPPTDQSKTIDSATYGGKRVVMEEIAMNGSLTNDFYDYTKAPQTERYYLDMARHRASWADRRSFAASTCTGRSSGGGQRVSNILSPAYQFSSGLRSISTSQADMNRVSIGMDTRTHMSDTMGRRHSRKVYSADRRKNVSVTGHDGMFFLGADNDLKDISVVTRKTIQHLNNKGEAENDSQLGLRKNVDSYIWYLIDPVAKRKYDLFLQKSITVHNKLDNIETSSTTYIK